MIIRTGHFEGNGAAVNLILGFVPDYFELVCDMAATNPDIIKWWRRHFNDDAKWGLLTTGSTGIITLSASAAVGVIPYDSNSISYVSRWTASQSGTAKTANAPGTFVRPSASSTADDDAIFECVTSGTAAATEPTWPKGIGQQVTDGTIVWERVNYKFRVKGGKGVTIGADIQTDAKEYYYLAIGSHEDKDHGDSIGW